MTVEFLEECRTADGRYFRAGHLADVPDDEARELIRTGRAKAFYPPDADDDTPDADDDAASER